MCSDFTPASEHRDHSWHVEYARDVILSKITTTPTMEDFVCSGTAEHEQEEIQTIWEQLQGDYLFILDESVGYL